MGGTHDMTVFMRNLVRTARLVERFISDMSYEQFKGDEKTIYAVSCGLEMVGQAVKHLPDSIQQPDPEVPWRKLGIMAEDLIHSYYAVDPRQVYITVRDDLPKVIAVVERTLHEVEAGGGNA